MSALKFDVADTQAARAAIEADIEANGAYYAVVLNAGITRDNTFVGIEDEDWFGVVDTNLNGFYNVLKPALMPMIRAKKPARIVVMSSVSGVIGNRGQSNYAASKAGLIGAAKSRRASLAKYHRKLHRARTHRDGYDGRRLADRGDFKGYPC